MRFFLKKIYLRFNFNFFIFYFRSINFKSKLPSGSKRVASEEIIELDEPAYINPSKKTMLTTSATTEDKKLAKSSKNNYLTNMILIKKKETPTVSANPVPKTSIGGLALLGDYSDSE